MSIRLSVLMPVFNEAQTVEEAIGSVLECDALPERELIIVDDGSTAGTRELDEVRVLATLARCRLTRG